MNKMEKLYLAIGVCLTTFACIHESQAATVLHVPTVIEVNYEN